MKAQLNLRQGPSKDGFRILQRFPNMKEARRYLQSYVKVCNAYQPTSDPGVYYNPKTDTQIWLSRQFTPSGIYTYPRLKQQK